MRDNPVKAKLQRGETAIGTMLFEFFVPGIPRLMAHSGAEFVKLPLENNFGVRSQTVLPGDSATLPLPIGVVPHGTWPQAFGYVIEGEMIFELEGEPELVVRAGDTFWEPGGDVIHYQDGNNLADAQTRFVVTMFGVPGQPMLIPVSAEELEERRSRRAPRP